MFQRPFSFEGRIRRMEYGLSIILYYAAIFALSYIEELTGNTGMAIIGFVPVIWFFIAQGAKRCHDRGNHGGWQLIPFYMLWMIFADGEPRTNQYGKDPKGRGDLLEELLAEETPSQPVQL